MTDDFSFYYLVICILGTAVLLIYSIAFIILLYDIRLWLKLRLESKRKEKFKENPVSFAEQLTDEVSEIIESILRIERGENEE